MHDLSVQFVWMEDRPPSPTMLSLFYSLGQNYIPDNRDADDPDDDGEDTGETLCSPIDNLPQPLQGDPDDLIGSVLRDHDRDHAEGKIQRAWSWLEEIMFGSDGF